jgi:excinuclease ABC subunit C
MEARSIKIPEVSGVYTFWKGQTPIYIGKAVNLKSRVSSYFALNLLPKTRRMVTEADNITYLKVDSEFEALLLEAKLIRLNQPKYNSALKDDKHPLYITITKDEFPRVVTSRASGDFGPFPSSTNVKQVLKMIRRIFPFSDHKIGKRQCLYSQIGLCNPCPSTIKDEANKAKYLSNIRRARAILKGNVKKVKGDLEKDMSMLSKQNRYEEAIEIREKIKRLEYITQPRIPIDSYLLNPNLLEDVRVSELRELKTIIQKTSEIRLKKLRRIECYDVSHIGGSFPTASMVVFTNGEADKSEYRHFKIRQKASQSDYDSIKEVARRRARQSWPEPDLVIIDGGVGQVKSFNSKHFVVGIAKNPDRLIIGKEKIKLAGLSLSLVQRMRDEAHRFARRYHHKLISINLAQ